MKEIKLSQRNKNGKNKSLVAFVDDEDFDIISQYKWHVKKTKGHFSARRWITQGNAISMHRQIMGLSKEDKIIVDHIDHNPLNNQRNNLRICTTVQNSVNRVGHGVSKYLGVSWDNRIKRWRSQIKENGKIKHLCCSIFEEDAAIAYDKKAIELYGEFANLNFK